MRFVLKTKSIVVPLLTLLSATAMSASASEPEQRFNFQGQAAIIFSAPMTGSDEKNFGENWKRATYLSPTGKQYELLSMEYGDAVFEKGYPPKISPSGRYAVLDVLRIGMLESGPNATPEPKSRQYCPVLDTGSGCIISMQTGDLCGGEWSSKSDTWVVRGMAQDDVDNGMLNYNFDSVNVLWQAYLIAHEGKSPYSIKTALRDNLGLANMLTCEPPEPINVDAYAGIARELTRENDRGDAKLIQTRLKEASRLGESVPTSMIIVDKAPLYDQPDETYKTRMYLVKGDQVTLLDTTKSNWILIKYETRKGGALLKWLRADSVKLN